MKYFFMAFALFINIKANAQINSFIEAFLVKRGAIESRDNFSSYKNSQIPLINSFSQSSFEITPRFSSSDFDFPTNDFTQENYELDLLYRKEFNWGGDIRVNFNINNAERSGFSDQQENQSWDIQFNQSLLRNWRGYRDILQSSSQVLRLDQDQNQISEERIRLCHEAIELYNQTHSLQEQQKVLELIKNKSQDIHYLNQKKYRKKLISKIDYLLSQRNLQRSLNSYTDSLNEFNNSKEEFSFYSPYSSLSSLDLSFDFEQNESLGLKEQKQLLAFYQNQKKIIKARGKFDVQFQANLGQSQRQNDFSFSVEGDNERLFYSAGLNVIIPLSSANNKQDLNENRYQYLKTANNLKQVKESFDLNFKIYKNSLKQIKEKIKQLKKLQVTNNKLLREADQLIKINKLEFKDYLEYLNQFLRNKLNIIENQFLYNKSITDFARLYRSPINSCKGWINE